MEGDRRKFLILLIFPMVFCVLRANALAAKYTDSGAMAVLMATPVKRKTMICTQLAVLLSGVSILVLYAAGLELAVAESQFPGKLVLLFTGAIVLYLLGCVIFCKKDLCV